MKSGCNTSLQHVCKVWRSTMYVFDHVRVSVSQSVMSFSAGDAVGEDMVEAMSEAQVEEVVRSNDFTPTPKTVGGIGLVTPICPHTC